MHNTIFGPIARLGAQRIHERIVSDWLKTRTRLKFLGSDVVSKKMGRCVLGVDAAYHKQYRPFCFCRRNLQILTIIIQMIPYISPLRRSMRLFRTLLLLIEIERFDRGYNDLPAWFLNRTSCVNLASRDGDPRALIAGCSTRLSDTEIRSGRSVVW
jgi:hypothetical protein